MDEIVELAICLGLSFKRRPGRTLEDKFVRFPDFLVDLESLRISSKKEIKAKSHSFGKEEKNKSSRQRPLNLLEKS